MEKGGKPINGTPDGTVEAPPIVKFDRKAYQREYMRKYREAGRDRSRKNYREGK